MLKNLVLAASLYAVTTTVSAGVAHAAIYDTGLGVNGAVDSHWTVAQVGGSFKDDLGLTHAPHAYIATVQPSFPFNDWSAPLGSSNWIVPTFNGPAVSLDPNKDGFFLYSQLFSVAAGTTISGQFLADNDVTKIALFDLNTFKLTMIYNGAGEGNFTSPTSFSLGTLSDDHYVLSFLVDNFRQNGGNPSGLDVSVSAVPESSTWAMMILGFLGVGFMSYRRKTYATVRLA
jgi:hypothetical protein